MPELTATATTLLTAGLLLAASVLIGRVTARFSVPVFLIFLVIGMLAGSEGPGGIFFADFDLSFRIGTIALILILFDGGLNTPWRSVRRGIPAASVLATVGVAGTALVLAVGARLLGFS